MQRFDDNGMMIFPLPEMLVAPRRTHILLVRECFCERGHKLVNDEAMFNGHPGIVLRVSCDGKRGIVALSPVYGDRCRISFGIQAVPGVITSLYCPQCDVELPVYDQCACGADLYTLFLTEKADFSDCIGICSRVDCFNSVILSGNELLTQAQIEREISGMVQGSR